MPKKTLECLFIRFSNNLEDSRNHEPVLFWSNSFFLQTTVQFISYTIVPDVYASEKFKEKQICANYNGRKV